MEPEEVHTTASAPDALRLLSSLSDLAVLDIDLGAATSIHVAEELRGATSPSSLRAATAIQPLTHDPGGVVSPNVRTSREITPNARLINVRHARVRPTSHCIEPIHISDRGHNKFPQTFKSADRYNGGDES